MGGISITQPRCESLQVIFVSLQILQQLDQCKGYPDFNNYLAFIFAQGDTLPIEVTLA